MLVRLLLLSACLAMSLGLSAQTGHPAKGSWSGDLSSSQSDQTRIRLLIKAHNGDLSGSVNPGRRGIEMSNVSLDAANWTLTIKAPMPDGELVLTGKLSNLGSWTNRQYIGTYTLGDESGEFNISLN